MKKIIILSFFIFSFSFSYAQLLLTPMDEGSKVHFVIRNFGFKTGGDFTGLKGTIRFDPNNITLWAFDVTVDASTVDTDNNSRDSHLRKADYFDVQKFPTIHIASKKIEATSKPGVYLLHGDLTIKGITRPVKFTFVVKNTNAGYLFIGDFEINRRDFTVGDDSISLSDNLKVSLSIFAK